MNPQWSDEVKERYTKDQEFYAQCSARGIQIRLNTDTLNWEGHMIRKPIGITAPYRKDDDDDIQAYVKPWVGLTEKEVEDYWDWEDFQCGCGRGTLLEMVKNIEAKLKEKNT